MWVKEAYYERGAVVDRQLGERIFEVCAIVLIIVLCISTLYPFVSLLSLSLSSSSAAAQYGLRLWPAQWSVDAYAEALKGDGIAIGFTNTVLRTVLGTALTLVFILFAAYPLSKTSLPHRGLFTMIIIFTMFAGGQLFLIPWYLLVTGLGFRNSIWALVVPQLGNTFAMFVLRNYLMTLSPDLEESAKMEGANDFTILFRIIVPLIKPVLATVTLWITVFHWNQWFDALIFNTDRRFMVLQTYLRKLIIESSNIELNLLALENQQEGYTEQTVKAAVLMISTIPVLVVYPFLQKHFTKGFMIGALKG